MATTRSFRLTSGGSAYNLNVGFIPTKVKVTNETKWATDGENVNFYWHKGMTAAYALTEVADATGINRILSTSNGFTEYDASSITDNSRVITAITAANPCMVSITGSIGATAAADGAWIGIDDVGSNTKPFGDSVKFDDITGMTELNSVAPIKIKSWKSATEFYLDLDASSYTTYSVGSGRNAVLNISTDIKDSGFKGITLGTVPMCNNGDVLFIECEMSDSYVNLGDVG